MSQPHTGSAARKSEDSSDSIIIVVVITVIVAVLVGGSMLSFWNWNAADPAQRWTLALFLFPTLMHFSSSFLLCVHYRRHDENIKFGS